MYLDGFVVGTLCRASEASHSIVRACTNLIQRLRRDRVLLKSHI